MKQDLSDKRKVYNKNFIDFNDLKTNPLDQFKIWYDEAAKNSSIDEANAMTISTIELDGFPRNRVVLLKEFNSEGYIFYTNYNSDKGKALEVNSSICLSFFWAALQRQVIIKGIAEKVDEKISDEYFATRPRESQIGAWASPQSEFIAENHDFEKVENELKLKFENEEIPRPKHWGGYLVKPVEVEFWQGRPSRLHDRILYKKNINGEWEKFRQAP